MFGETIERFWPSRRPGAYDEFCRRATARR
jgi:hypothetical protein